MRARSWSLLFLVVLAAAWYAVLPRPALARVDALIHEHERLHFALHLTLGHALDLCPCGEHLADEQFAKAGMHAPAPEMAALVPPAPTTSTFASARGLARATALLARATLTDLPLRPAAALVGGVALGLAVFALGYRALVFIPSDHVDRRGEPVQAFAGALATRTGDLHAPPQKAWRAAPGRDAAPPAHSPFGSLATADSHTYPLAAGDRRSVLPL